MEATYLAKKINLNNTKDNKQSNKEDSSMLAAELSDSAARKRSRENGSASPEKKGNLKKPKNIRKNSINSSTNQRPISEYLSQEINLNNSEK